MNQYSNKLTEKIFFPCCKKKKKKKKKFFFLFKKKKKKKKICCHKIISLLKTSLKSRLIKMTSPTHVRKFSRGVLTHNGTTTTTPRS